MNTKCEKPFLREFLLIGAALLTLTLLVRGSAGGLLLNEATSTPTMDPNFPAFPTPVNGAGPTLAISLTPTPTSDPNWPPSPTETPHIYSTIIDLSPELSENEEYFVFVQTETGEEIVYTIGPVISGYRDELPASIAAQIPLGPHDILRGGVPFYPGRRSLSELLGHTPTAINPYPFGLPETHPPLPAYPNP